MSDRTRLVVLATVLALIAPVSLPSDAQPFISCWVEMVIDPLSGQPREVTVCRLADGEVTEFPGDTPPGDVNPAVGTDSNGICWFWTSTDTDWELLSRFADGSAVLGIYVNGFLALDTGRIPRCTDEPVVDDPPNVYAWEAITEYVHNPPEPDLNPPIGRGLTGLDTFAGVVVPGPWTDTITIPGYAIDVEVSVAALDVDWGDEKVDTFPPDAYPLLTGYPDGIASHMYEVKTCAAPGVQNDCHPTLDSYPVTIAYIWAARWRANGGPWLNVNVPPSETTVDYPVTEAISALIAVG